MMKEMVRFGISMEKKLSEDFDTLILRRGYTNRSEAVRDLIRDYMVEEEWRERNLPGAESGVLVQRVLTDSPASKAGVEKGDVLVAVNGKKIISPDDYFRVFQELSVASEIRFDLLREGRPETISYPIVD